MVVIAESSVAPQQRLDNITKEDNALGLRININKTSHGHKQNTHLLYNALYALIPFNKKYHLLYMSI